MTKRPQQRSNRPTRSCEHSTRTPLPACSTDVTHNTAQRPARCNKGMNKACRPIQGRHRSRGGLGGRRGVKGGGRGCERRTTPKVNHSKQRGSREGEGERQGNGGGTEEVTAREGGRRAAAAEVGAALGWQVGGWEGWRGGRRRWKEAQLAPAYIPTHQAHAHTCRAACWPLPGWLGSWLLGLFFLLCNAGQRKVQ